MQDEDKVYGLIAQAEDIQAHAVKLQQAAQDAVSRLPEATRSAARDAAREIITEATESASKRLLSASHDAATAGAALKRTGVFLALLVVCVAGVAGAGMHFYLRYAEAGRLDELAQLRQQIAKERAMLNQASVWGLELVDYGDGTRGIILPKGAKVDRTGAVPDGRTGVVIRP